MLQLLSDFRKVRNMLPAPSLRTRAPGRILMLCCVALVFGVPGLTEAQAAKLKPGTTPPALRWTRIDGNEFSWNELRGDRPLVVVFWATWCSTCRKDWPKLKKLAARYENSAISPVWAAISLGEPAGRVAPVAQKYGLPGHVLVDPNEVNGKKLGIEFVPEVCVLDRAGKVAYYGAPKIGKLDAILAELSPIPVEAETK